MARQTIPKVQPGGGMLRKLVGTVMAAVVLVMVVKHPADAAMWVKSVINWIDGLTSFVQQLGH
ncbi:hypothetical protein [Amycolatopsis alkalitolerans]|uniref:Uncharacterized protein n=1 Tax=Amycolatopsis alkalitolerans TaxID=2547244 RepID=A0A5C4LQS9_9PSEU|nr:hypothetical protein [Amycolatopsis alkalitolerans]TNC20889.1 hypothetical protein FG385_29840 [Amycolatopsis alkalitolerans]